GMKGSHASSSDWTVRRIDEGIYRKPHRIAKLAETMEDTLQELDRTVFFIDFEPPPADRREAGELFSLLRRLQASGARHLGYGPDDPARDAPPLKTIAPAISQREYPDEM
ncbi:MAG TPA: hypothetical protein VJ882_07375, partial [Desulfuromonadales bacterium]|nr:hypothetical protein [Desulfuromonadales bacterium]